MHARASRTRRPQSAESDGLAWDAAASPMKVQKRRHHKAYDLSSLPSLSISEVVKLTHDLRKAYDRVLTSWSAMHIPSVDPPPKFNNKHGNLAANNTVLYDWFHCNGISSLACDGIIKSS